MEPCNFEINDEQVSGESSCEQISLTRSKSCHSENDAPIKTFSEGLELVDLNSTSADLKGNIFVQL